MVISNVSVHADEILLAFVISDTKNHDVINLIRIRIIDEIFVELRPKFSTLAVGNIGIEIPMTDSSSRDQKTSFNKYS